MTIPTIPTSGFCLQAPGKPPTKQAAMALRFYLSYLLSNAWNMHGWIIGIQIIWNDASLLWKVYIVILLPILDFRCEQHGNFSKISSASFSWTWSTSRKWDPSILEIHPHAPKMIPQDLSRMGISMQPNSGGLKTSHTCNQQPQRVSFKATSLHSFHQRELDVVTIFRGATNGPQAFKDHGASLKISELSLLSRLRGGNTAVSSFFWKGDDVYICIYKLEVGRKWCWSMGKKKEEVPSNGISMEY